MPNINKIIEEQKEEFEKMLLEDGVPSENRELYGQGSISEWLKNNEDKHLYFNEVYGEPMLDLNSDKVWDWHIQSLKQILESEIERELNLMKLKKFL